MNRIEKGSLLVLAIIVAFNIFFGLGSIPLLDPDEPVYAETAREMIQFNDYLSPRIYNEYWFDKPPMYYWLVAGSMHVFGDSEFAARFPAAVMAFLTVIMLYCSVTRLFNEKAGFWSALVLATSVQFFYLGKAAVTDTTLVFFLTGALLCYLHKKYWLMYVCMALATVTKGPIGIVFPGAIIFLHILCTGQWRLILKMHCVAMFPEEIAYMLQYRKVPEVMGNFMDVAMRRKIIIEVGPARTEEPQEPEPTPTTQPEEEKSKYFDDMADYKYAVKAVDAMAQRGMIRGTQERCFSPGANITREEFTKLVVSALLETNDVYTKEYFKDPSGA